MKPRTSVSSVVVRMSGKFHHHGCSECRLQYSDACMVPDQNRLCQACRGNERPLWERNGDPVDCCYGNSFQVRDAETLSRYALAGMSPWYKCRVCARIHPYEPKVKP